MVALLPLLLAACAAQGGDVAAVSAHAPSAAIAAPDERTAGPDVFTAWLEAPIPVADGFTVPAGEPCGDGCWTRPSGTPVLAVAAGVVREATADTLVTEHLWYEDHEKRTATLRWEGITPSVTAGARITRGQPLGTAATLRLVAPALGPIDAFLAGRPRLAVPQSEPVLALVSHDLDQMRIYVDGAAIGTFEVGFGQAEGDKEQRGDNRTPKGMYHVVYRSKGPFDGPFGAYYGGRWIKLGYPNPWDAARGVDAGLVDGATQRAITRAFWARRMPPQGTALGGGIGLHGWAYEWSDEADRGMSWGCVVLHLRDVGTVYDTLREGAMVVLF